MDDPVLRRAAEILETEPGLYLAVEELWERLRHEGLLADSTPDDLQHMLQSDSRFEVTQGPVLPGMTLEGSRQTLRALDLFSGPSVKLVSRPITLDAVLEGLTHSLRQLETALQRAWRSRPPKDEKTEQVLRQAMERTDALRAEIERVIASVRPPSTTEDNS